MIEYNGDIHVYLPRGGGICAPVVHFLSESLFLEKKIFEGFLPYMGMAAILVM